MTPPVQPSLRRLRPRAGDDRLAYVAVIKAEARRAEVRQRFEAAHDQLRWLWQLPPMDRGISELSMCRM